MKSFDRKKLLLAVAFIFFILVFSISGSLIYYSGKNVSAFSPIADNTVPENESSVANIMENNEGLAQDLLLNDTFALNNTESIKKDNSNDNEITYPEGDSSEVGKPAKIVIPSIDVTAKILHIGLTNNGDVGVPEDRYDTSWFDLGPKPGEKGNSLISGHSGIWKDGSNSIFDNLHKLNIGDVLYVYDEKGVKRSFVVKNTRIYGKDDVAPELFESSENKNLNIITCYGDWIKGEKTYTKRFVVFTEML